MAEILPCHSARPQRQRNWFLEGAAVGIRGSKLFDEHLAFAYQDAYGFPVTILRFFGSYGPRQHLSWWGGPQSVFIDCVLKGKPMPIHGDGSQTRSFTYVSDTVEGIYQATLRPESVGEVINIGSTDEVTSSTSHGGSTGWRGRPATRRSSSFLMSPSARRATRTSCGGCRT